MIGTELEFIPPAHAEITGSTAQRLPEVHTNATTDLDLLAVWLKAHADGSRHTRRAYERIGRRFVEALGAAGASLKRATVEDVQNALEVMRAKADGSTSSAASVNTYVAAVKAFLGFAHKVGYTRFNAAPLIKLKKAPRKIAQRLLSQVELHLLLRAADPSAIASFWRLPTSAHCVFRSFQLSPGLRSWPATRARLSSTS